MRGLGAAELNLFDLFAKISLDTSEYDSGVKDVTKSGSSLASKLKSGLASAGKAAAVGIGAITTAAGAAVGGLLALKGATEEYRVAQGKLNTAFEAAGYSADAAREAYYGFYGILGDTDTATEASQLLAKLVENEEDVVDWTDIAAGVFGTFGDSLPIEGLIEASNETAKVGQVTGVLADALNWAGISEDEFNEKLSACTSESERNQLITETLTETYDEAASAFYKNNQTLVQSRDAQTMLMDAMSKFGQTVSDVKTRLMGEFVPAFANVATAFSDMLTGTEGADKRFSEAVEELVDTGLRYLPEFIDLGAKILASVLSGIVKSVPAIVSAIPSALAEIGPAIANAIGVNVDTDTIESAIWDLVSVFQALLPAVTGVTAAVIAYRSAMAITALIQGVSSAIAAFKAANEGATIAQAALNAVMAANPFALVAMAIAGVITALTALCMTNEDFRNSVSAIWEEIKVVFEAAWTAIKAVWDVVGPYFAAIWEGIKVTFSVVADVLTGFFSAAWSGITGVWDAATGFFENIWNTIEGIFSVVESVLSGDFEGAWEAIKYVFSGWKQYFTDRWNDLTNIFNQSWDFFSGIGSDIVDGIKSGISSAWDGLTSWFNGIWNSLFGNRKATVEVEEKHTTTRANGSHAGGLGFVPFNGYLAELHKGEMVVPANQADMLRDIGFGVVGFQNSALGQSARFTSGTSTNSPIYITVQSVLDGKVIGETAYQYSRNKARAYGG